MRQAATFVCTYMQMQTVFILQLHLWHDFENIVFKIKHEFYVVLHSAPSPLHPPQWKIMGVHPNGSVWLGSNEWMIKNNKLERMLENVEFHSWLYHIFHIVS